jgi:putative peptide zinc metalloprotease protein
MQAADTPQKRPDLVLTPTTDEGRTLTVVFDPRAGRYFRIREMEGHLLSLLDGERSLEAVHEETLREFPGAKLSLETVVRFAAKLGELGLLAGAEPGSRRRAPFYRRLARIKLPPVPADWFFLGVQPLVRVLYHPVSLAAVALGMLFVGHWAFFSVEEYVRHAPSLLSPSGLLLTLAGLVLVGIWHEIGHGVTCRYFGARCNGVGFFLLYGIPCFYTDVSAAWTLSGRRERLLIGIAGLAWQFALGAAAFVAWKALEPYTLPGRLAHAMVGACGLTALLNLHPLIKLDGYYLLSDWWRIPNLREKSLGHLRQRLAAFFTTAPAPALGSRRERRIFFWFGLASACYSILLIALLGWRLSAWLLETAGGTGALILGVLVMASIVTFVRNAWNSLRRDRGSGQTGGASGADGSGEGNRSGGGAASPRVRPRASLLLTLALIMGGIYWFWNASWSFFVASPCTLEAEERVAVRPLVEGVLQEVRYREGERVEPGATLALLESFDLQKDRQQLRQRVESVEAATEVIRQQVPLVEAENERDVTEARQEVREAQRKLEDQESVYPIRRAESERRVQEARAALDQADRVADRGRADERAVAEGRLTPAMQAVAERIARARAQKDLAQKEVRRAVFLVNEGALQRQRLDSANAELQTLEREEAALESELQSLRKTLLEQREDAEAEVRRRRAAYEAALEAQRLVEQETRPEKLEAAREEIAAREAVLETTHQLRKAADVKRAEASARRMEARPIETEAQRVETKIRQTRVVASVGGVLSTPRVEEQVGRRFQKGETIAWIDRIETLTAKISVDEKEIGEVREGLPVQLRVGAFPDRVFEGRVLRVSPRAGGDGNRGAYEVRVRIQNPRGDLRPGITGYTKIIAGERPLREVAFRRLYRYVRTEVWTWF